MKRKLIKKYQAGGSPRLYNYLPLPPKDKWNGITSIKDLEGNELNPGDLVLANSEGKMVTPDNTLAYLDYMAANNIPILGPTLNQITVTHNNQTGKTTTSLGENFEDRLKRLLLNPVANDSLLKLLWLELGELLWNLSHDKHIIDTRLADKTANAKTPEALSIMSPALIGIAAILGFESATAMAAWAAAYPEAFTGIVGSTLGGEIINLATNLGSGGKYKDWGDAANLIWGIGETLGGFTNPGYFVNPLSKGISAIELNGKRLFDLTLAQLNGSWALRALNTANKYNLGEGVKAGIYNTALSLLYSPEVAAKAGLNHLKLKVQDAGWYTKNFFTKDALNAWKDMYQNYLLVKFNPKAFKPSDRAIAKQFFDTKVSANNYYLNGTSPNFLIKGTQYATSRGPDFELIKTPIKFEYYPKDRSKNNFRFLDPQAAKKLIVYDWSFTDGDAESILTGEAGKILEGPLLDKYYPLVVGGLVDIHNPNKVLSTEAQEVNATLGDLGHVLGSQVTVLNPYATHTPKDIDIITTDRNLPEVLKRLNLTIVKDDGWHIVANSPKYGDMDIQIIQHSTNGSKGRIAFLTYAKMDPLAYNNILRSGVYEVPLTPEELLKVHRDNVLHFSNLDALVSGSSKHAERVRQLLLSPDKNIIRLAINDLENIYSAHLGKDFFPLEELGVHIDYNDVNANIEFLKKFGLLNPEYLAKNPDKMEFLIKYLLYRTHIANRTVEKTPAMDALDVVKAILTNASYSNYGGNAAAGKFGGGIRYYGGSNPYIGNILYPVNHPEKLKNAMDLYNYLGKMIDVEEVWKGLSYGPWGGETPLVNTELLANFYHDFPIPLNVSRLLSTTLHFLNFLTGKERLFDILHHIVPNRNPELNLYDVRNNPLEREVLSDINDTVGKTLDISHVFSVLPGFGNAFFGKLLKDVPNLRYNIVKGSDANGTYFNGFELPRVSLKIPKGRSIQMNPTHTFNPRMWDSNAVKRGQLNASKKLNNAIEIVNKASRGLGSLYNAPLTSIDVTKGILKVSPIPLTIGGLFGGIWYMNRNRPSYNFYHNIWNKVPYGLYGKTPKQIQEYLAHEGIILDDNDLQLISFNSEEDFYDTLEELLVNKYDK